MVLGYLWVTIVIVFETLLEHIKSFIPTKLLPKDDISGEIALVTGAGSGIGRQIALELARKGCHLILWDINEAGNTETNRMIVEEGGRPVSAYVVDVTNPENVYTTADKVRKEVGDVSLLVNNAGTAKLDGVMSQSDDTTKKTLDLNTFAPILVTRAFLQPMLNSNHGYIVNISSVAGVFGLPALSSYCASKFGIYGFSETLEMELKYMNKSVHVLRVCPGVVKTPLTKEFADTVNPQHKRGSGDEYLDAQFLAQKIVEAMRAKREFLMLPNIFYPLLLLYKILPRNRFAQLMKATVWDTTELLN